MHQRRDKVLSKRDKSLSIKDKAMNDTTRARELFLEAYPDIRFNSVKEQYREAHRFLSKQLTKVLTFRRLRAIREGKARRVDGEELDALRLAVIEEARNDAKTLRARLVALDEKIAAFDAVTARQALEKGGRHSGRMG